VREEGSEQDRRKRRREFKRKYSTKNHPTRRSGADRHQSWRRWAAYMLISLGAVVALAHLGTHASAFGLNATPLEDLLVGYPTAAVLAILGASLLPAGRR